MFSKMNVDFLVGYPDQLPHRIKLGFLILAFKNSYRTLCRLVTLSFDFVVPPATTVHVLMEIASGNEYSMRNCSISSVTLFCFCSRSCYIVTLFSYPSRILPNIWWHTTCLCSPMMEFQLKGTLLYYCLMMPDLSNDISGMNIYS